MAEKKIIAILGATGAQGGGLARAVAADRGGGFAARAITRTPDSTKARALAAQGIEVVQGDADDHSSLERAFAGAYGTFCVTNYWEYFSPEREVKQAAAMARAARKAGVRHAIWSTLEDTRKDVPLDDPRMPVLMGRYHVPHFEGKAEADVVFAGEGPPTSFLLLAFFWENFILFGAGPRPGDDGRLTLALPLGGARLPGIATEDVGTCAYGIFRRGPESAGQRLGIAGETLSGDEMARKMARALGREVRFTDVPFDVYRGLGFPGAEDMGNMFQWQAILGEEFDRRRDPALARALHPGLLDFDAWLDRNASRIPIPQSQEAS